MSGADDIDALVVARRVLEKPSRARLTHDEMLAIAGCLIGLDQVIEALEAAVVAVVPASPAQVKVPTTNARLAAAIAVCMAAHEGGLLAPPDAALAQFTAYFVRNYPGPDTIIGDPNWHAPKIFRAAAHAIKGGSPPASQAFEDAFNTLRTIFETEFPHVAV